MNRRRFLQVLSASGLLACLPWRALRSARAGGGAGSGPLFLHMHARGGWDPTLLCDAKLSLPKLNADGTPAQGSNGQPLYLFENRLVDEVALVNGVPVPGPKLFFRTSDTVPKIIESPHEFFTHYGKRVLVLNGLDTETNSHSGGIQEAMAGDINKRLPALAALFAGRSPETSSLPVAFIVGGTYNATSGLVSPSRPAGAPVQSALHPFDKGANGFDLSGPEAARMRDARLARAQEQALLTTSAREAEQLASFQQTVAGESVLTAVESAFTEVKKEVALTQAEWKKKYSAFLPPEGLDFCSSDAQRGELYHDVEVILQCFAAGVSAGANYCNDLSNEVPTFDTHGLHDKNHPHAMGMMLARLRYVLFRAELLGLTDRLTVIVTSDFGRTPTYQGLGKDHWNITSALVIAPNVAGGRVLGGTDAQLRARLVSTKDPTHTRTIDELTAKGVDQASTVKSYVEGGETFVRVRTSHFHRALRQALAIPSTLSAAFPLPPDASPFDNLLS